MAGFSKKVSEDLREILRDELKRYEDTVPMTIPERRELHKWVHSGHSPYSCGGDLYDEGGRECDFITWYRFWGEYAFFHTGGYGNAGERPEHL